MCSQGLDFVRLINLISSTPIKCQYSLSRNATKSIGTQARLSSNMVSSKAAFHGMVLLCQRIIHVPQRQSLLLKLASIHTLRTKLPLDPNCQNLHTLRALSSTDDLLDPWRIRWSFPIVAVLTLFLLRYNELSNFDVNFNTCLLETSSYILW